jgi:hypothetical protein
MEETNVGELGVDGAMWFSVVPLTDPYEHDTQPSGFIKDGEFD